MNCEQGDIAIIVKSTCGNEDKVVKCIEFVGFLGEKYDGANYWLVDREIAFSDGSDIPYAKDEWLRPIRDPGDDAVDEMVERCGTPLQRQIRELTKTVADMQAAAKRLGEALK